MDAELPTEEKLPQNKNAYDDSPPNRLQKFDDMRFRYECGGLIQSGIGSSFCLTEMETNSALRYLTSLRPRLSLRDVKEHMVTCRGTHS